MTVTFVGASSAQGSNVHASVPSHQAGDVILAFALRTSTNTAPSVGTGWTVINQSLATVGYSATVAYRIASSSGTSNTGWSNFNYQSLVIYRGAVVVNTTWGVSLGFDNYPIIGAGPFYRPGANLRVLFFTVFIYYGGLSQTLNQPNSRTLVVRGNTGGSGLTYQQLISDESNQTGNYNYSYSLDTPRRWGAAAVELLDASVVSSGQAGSFALDGAIARVSSLRSAEAGYYAVTEQPALFKLSLVANPGQFSFVGDTPKRYLLSKAASGGVSLVGTNALLSTDRQAQAAPYSLLASDIHLRFTAPVQTGGFVLTLNDTSLALYKPNYSSGAISLPNPPTQSYGGSDPTQPSFLRPYYVKYNSISKSLDLGTLDNLLGVFKGHIGSQAGTNTIYITVHTTGAADIRITKNSINRHTDQYISVGILDANRKPLSLTATGYAYANEIINTPQSEFEARPPAGVYYFTVSSSQWQSLPFSINAQVFRYIELSGTAEVTAPCTARLPLVKTGGLAALTNQSAGTLLSPSELSLAQGAAALSGSPSLTITIMRGVALLQATPYGRLKQTRRISGSALVVANPSGMLTVTSPYGY